MSEMIETYEQKRDREKAERERFRAVVGGFMGIGSIIAATNAALHLPEWLLVGYLLGYWPAAVVYRDHIHDRLVEWRFRRAWKRRT